MTIKRTWATFLLTTGPWTLPAFAQTATSPTATGAAPTEVQNDEIIVTANKRNERVRDVALSITAISGAELNARRLVDIQDLASRVPGFSFSRGGSQGPGQRIIIRGLNTGGPAGTVASVLDDVPLTASAQSSAGGEFAADFDPYDLNRIEVLKGPQGTLYGASSLGGLVKYVTKAPDTHDVHLGMDFGFTDLKHGGLGAFGKGYVNLPIASDKAAFRASGYYEYQPGWIDNKLGGTTQTNDVHRYGGRASLLLKPVEDLTLRLTAVLQDRQSGGYDTVEVRGYLDDANPLALLSGYNKGTYVAEPNTAHSEIYAGNLDYDIGRVRLQSITSYAKLKTTYRYDNPFYAGLSGLFFGRANTTLSSESVNRVEKFSQELRLVSNNSASANGHGLEYQLGLFYTRETSQSANTYLTRDIATGAPVITPASVAATPPGTPNVFLGDIGTKYREYAGYIDLTYHFSPRFDIQAVGRVFHNEQSFTQGTGGALFAPPTFTTVGPFSSSETRGTFAVAPRFHVNRNLILYARAASGYRPGGPNVAIPRRWLRAIRPACRQRASARIRRSTMKAASKARLCIIGCRSTLRAIISTGRISR